MAHPTLSALKTQKTVAAVTRCDYFSNLTKTESQFKISLLNFFHFFLHHNTSWYIVVLGRRKNLTLFWASFGKLNFLTGRGRGEQWRRRHQPVWLVSIFALSNYNMRIYVWIWKTFSFSNRSCSQKFQWKGGITEESFPCSWIIWVTDLKHVHHYSLQSAETHHNQYVESKLLLSGQTSWVDVMYGLE